jgi:hypothetical protein
VGLDLNLVEQDPMGSTTALYPASEAAVSTPSPARPVVSRKAPGGLAPRPNFTKNNMKKLAAPFRRGKAKAKARAKATTEATPFVPRNKLEKMFGERVPEGYEVHRRK